MGKTIKDLVFKDNFMFAAVMMDEDIAKGVLERALGIEISRVEVSYEKSIVYNPEYKGIRLDVYVKDQQGTHFDVEMQVANEEIKKRARYYHSQIDMELLLAGTDYANLPNTYVIFICDFDPLGLGKYKYTMKQIVTEAPSYEYDDGCRTVFLSTKGTNDDEVSESLRNFLKFAGADKEKASDDYQDEFVSKLQKSVEKIRNSREMGASYMKLEELLNDKFKAGKAEGLAEGQKVLLSLIIGHLSDIAPVSDNLEQRISSIKDLDKLSQLCKTATIVSSHEEFEAELDKMNLESCHK